MYRDFYRSFVDSRRGKCLVVLAGVCALAACAADGLPGSVGRVEAAGSSKYLLQYDVKRGEVLTYQVLISETIYSDGKRATSLYREDVRIENSTSGDGKVRQTVICAGTATPEGGPVHRLEPFRYCLTLEKTGRIIEAEGLRPWDGRQVETVWFAQVILADRPVAPGDTWTVNEEVYSTASGTLALERRTYQFVGIEKVGSMDAFKVKYEISRKGRTKNKDYTYVATGTFCLASGKLVKLESSEMVVFGGNGQDTKVITMVQVEIAK